MKFRRAKHPQGASVAALAGIAAVAVCAGDALHASFGLAIVAAGWLVGAALARKAVSEPVRVQAAENRSNDRATTPGEARYRGLIESLHEMIFRMTIPGGVYEYVSPAAERVIGFTAEQLLAEPLIIARCIHPDFRDFFEREWAKLQEGLVEPYFEYKIIDSSGAERWIGQSNVGIFDDAGRLVALEGICRDETARKQAEKVRLESEELFRGMFEQAAVGICQLSGGGRCLRANQKLADILGRTREELLETSAPSVVHPDDVGRLIDDAMRLWRGESAAGAIEVRGVRKDGSVIRLEVSSSLIRDEAGRPKSFIVAVQDVTARREAEAEIRRLNEQLEERIALRTSELESANRQLSTAKEEAEKANQAKNEFLSRMSHELRTPLNAVVGFAQLLLRSSLAEEDRECVEQILMGGEHLIHLIDDLIDISRIEAGRYNVTLQPTCPAVVLREAATLLERQASQHGVQIELDEETLSGRKVLADPQRLRQALLNMLSNAVKYNVRGGKVMVQGAVAPSGFQISIRDTGRGIDPDKMHRLFEPFNRLGAEKSEIEGTGLGLTLSKCLIEEMGGAVAVQSAPGVGSTFSIELRSAPDDAAPACRAAPEAAARPASGRVLTIDDDPTNRRLLLRVLDRELHLTAVSAASGAEGIRLAREDPPDLILLDLHLPDMHGEAILDALRRAPQTSKIPVIVVSGDVTPSAREESLRRGASAFIAKPYVIAKLVERIRTLLEAR